MPVGNLSSLTLPKGIGQIVFNKQILKTNIIKNSRHEGTNLNNTHNWKNINNIRLHTIEIKII
jgi:hypothetical protein